MKWLGRLFCLVVAVSGFAAAQLLAQEGNAAVPTVPTVECHRADGARPDGDDADPAGAVGTDPDRSHPGALDAVADRADTTARDDDTAGAPAAGRDPTARHDSSDADTASRTAPDFDDDHRPLGAAGRRDLDAAFDRFRPLPLIRLARRSGLERRPVLDGSAADNDIRGETYRSRNRVSVRLAFLLPKADRHVPDRPRPGSLVPDRGVHPCARTEGRQFFFFSGRVHGRRLEPGVYLISLSTNRRLDPAAEPEYVRVVSRRSSIPLPETAQKPSCDTAAAAASNSSSPVVLAEAQPKTPKPRPTASLAGAAVAIPTGDANDDGVSGVPESGVLGAATSDADEQPFVAIAVLTIVGALLLTMLVLVARFLRGSWNP